MHFSWPIRPKMTARCAPVARTHMIPVASSARTIARISCESGAMTDAALSGHFEEARNRARQLLIHAGDAQMYAVTEAVSALCICLGPPGTEPKAGFSW